MILDSIILNGCSL